VQVVEHHTGDGEGLTNAVTEIVCEPGASVHHVLVQDQAPTAFHIGRVAVRQARESRFLSHNLAFGAALSRTDLRVTLDGEGAECTLEGAFAVGGTQHVDCDTFVDHAKPHATSRELYKGVLNGKAHGVFTGRVLVRPGAVKTSAQQTNPNLLLSKSAHVDTRPQLEIHNDDVKCTHGATIGRLDPDSLFFLRARGIDFVEARRLLVAAFGGEIAERVGVPGLTEWLYERIAAVGGAQ
jgi:Fe-S cluster assembly protein SufD